MASLFSVVSRVDGALLRVPRRVQRAVVLATLLVIAATALAYVPRAYVDFGRWPATAGIRQYETYGTDTIADMYVARVVLNDVADMYTKAGVPQTPLEAATWTKEASAPYPPATLLTEAGLYWLGGKTGAGFYGMILVVAAAFLLLSADYFLKTRWYLFPLLYLNFTFWGYRFVHVQDGSYLLMLLAVMVALDVARRWPAASHLLMGLAITLKLSPLFYVRQVTTMRRGVAAAFIALIVAGLVLPLFIWDGYLGIYTFLSRDKGDWLAAAGALVVVVPVTLCIWYVEVRLGFDLEDRIGWSLVPLAMLAAFRQNAARHLLIVLLVPDKRGARNAAVGLALAVHYLLPGVVRLNSTLPIATAFLILALVGYLRRIGWDVVRDDLRHPARTMRMMASR